MNRKERRAAAKRAGPAKPADAAAPDPRLQAAFAHHSAGRLPEAARLYEQVLAAQPNDPVVLQHLGLLRWQAGDAAAGRGLVEQALRHAPAYAEAHYNLALILKSQGEPEAAVAALHEVLRLKPNAVEAQINLGALLSELGRHADSLAAARRAVELAPRQAEAHYNLAGSLNALGDWEAAAAAYETALALKPDFAQAWANLGNLRVDQNRLADAEQALRRALALDDTIAEAHANLGMLLLLQGRMAEGWPEYDWRWQARNFPERARPSPQPLWQGEALDGRRILLIGEQGLGDMLQFARYAALVAARGGHVLLRCDAKLAELLATLPGVAEIVVAGDALPAHDLWAPLMSLPRLFGTTLETIPADVPYLSVPPGSEVTLPPATGRRRVGILWAGSAANRTDKQRSCPLALFFDLARRPDVALHSLQVGARESDLKSLPPDVTIHDLAPVTQSFAAAAAAMQQLDLIVSVDTAPAHLAGALGRPVWVLLHDIPDWRYLLARDDSPWYPSMRLFRQRQSGNWPDVMARVAQALDQLELRGHHT